jgi:hypothetical protein
VHRFSYWYILHEVDTSAIAPNRCDVPTKLVWFAFSRPLCIIEARHTATLHPGNIPRKDVLKPGNSLYPPINIWPVYMARYIDTCMSGNTTVNTLHSGLHITYVYMWVIIPGYIPGSLFRVYSRVIIPGYIPGSLFRGIFPGQYSGVYFRVIILDISGV